MNTNTVMSNTSTVILRSRSTPFIFRREPQPPVQARRRHCAARIPRRLVTLVPDVRQMSRARVSSATEDSTKRRLFPLCRLERAAAGRGSVRMTSPRR